MNTSNYIEYMKEAYFAAQHLSDDMETRVGAVIVGPPPLESWVVVGANRFPIGSNHLSLKYSFRPLKYDYIAHAEVDVIAEACAIGKNLNHATLICPWAGCPPCCRDIANHGIRTVVIHKQMHNKTPERWAHKIHIGHEILRNAHIKIVTLDIPQLFQPGECEVLFDGQLWTP